MPDFIARVSLGAIVVPWSDPASASKPSRLNPHAGIAHQYIRASAGNMVEVRLTLTDGPFDGTAEAPLDGALGGRLFTWFWAEHPPGGAVPIFTPPGQSSLATFTFTTTGGYLLVAQRGSLPPSPIGIPSSKLGIHLRCE